MSEDDPARGAHRLRDAEVRDDRVPAGDEHVVRLDVAVHDAARVRVRERVDDVAQDADRVAHGHLAFARELRAQRLAFHERHRIVEEIADLPRGEHRHDVRMLERGGELDLAPEALDVHAAAISGGSTLTTTFRPSAVFCGEEDV